MNNKYIGEQSMSRRTSRRARRRRKMIIRAALRLVALLIIIGLVAFTITKCVNKKSNKKSASSGEVVKNTEVVTKNQTGSDVDAANEPVKKKETLVYPDLSKAYVELNVDTLKSPYIALLNVEDNKIVAGRNYNTKIYPASMTKVMTLIVAVENIKDMSQTFTITNELIDPLVKQSASRAGFDPNEIVSAKDLLYGLVLPSGADSAVALSEMVSGSEENFVALMNKKCEELGLKNTHFSNPCGLFTEDNYTTPEEMSMILAYAMKDETCKEILSTYQYTTASTPQHPEGILLTSTLFSRIYGNEVAGVTIIGGKTGYTVEAMQCLVSYAEKNGKHYVAVTAGAANKWDCIYDDFELYGTYAVDGQ